VPVGPAAGADEPVAPEADAFGGRVESVSSTSSTRWRFRRRTIVSATLDWVLAQPTILTVGAPEAAAGAPGDGGAGAPDEGGAGVPVDGGAGAGAPDEGAGAGVAGAAPSGEPVEDAATSVTQVSPGSTRASSRISRS
jgi:hypothetical protein